MTKVRRLSPILNESNIQGIIEEFLSFCKAQGLGEDSLRHHRYALQCFFDKHPGGLRETGQLKKSLAQMLQGKQDAYYNKLLNGVRKFFNYCIQEGLMDQNPAIQFKYRRPTIQVVEHSEEEVKSLIKIIDTETFAGLRDYGLVILMLDTGIRPSEALQLKVEDIDFSGRQIKVRREYSKTRIERYLPTSQDVLQVLKKLISVRPQDWKKDVPVLCSFDGHRLPTRGIQSRFRNYCRLIRADIKPYQLRHIFGLWFVRNGGDAFSLQTIMGHTTMDMTRVYVNLASEDVRISHEKASPLQNIVSRKRMRNL